MGTEGGGDDSCLRKRGSMLTRDEQTPSNEQTTTPWSISETNDHNEVRTNIISDRWLGITLRYDTFSLKVKASAITRISASVTLRKKRQQFSLGGIKEGQLVNNSSAPRSVLCLPALYASRSPQPQEASHYVFGSRRKKSIQQK